MEVPSSEQLMAEMAWIRRLARALVKDAAAADDVAQETWLVATEQQPETNRPLRPWLARVVVNLVRTRRKASARRDQREAAFDDGRQVATPAELIERVELQRAVADEVLALAEPYRSTVLLHFVEGLGSAEIARRLGIPDGTVRRRLKVALDQLREAMHKRTDSPRRGWLAALAPLARLPGPTPVPAAMGVFAMKKVIGIVVVLVLLLLFGGAMIWRHRAQHSRSPANSAPVGSRSKPGGPGEARPDRATIPAWLAQPGAPSRRIAGRVMSHGTPIAAAKVVLGLEVAGEPSSLQVMPDAMSQVLQPIAERTSAADGSFDFGDQPAARFTVSASAATYAAAAVAVDGAKPHTRSDHLVVELGDCHTRLFGTIADASGGGIAKAHISVAGLSGAESDATGAYSLCIAPQDAFGTPAAEVRIEADGYGTIKEDIITVGDLHHDFKLVPEAVLAGRVTTSDGRAVPGARVVAGLDPGEMPHHVASGWATSDPDGRFRIAGLAPGNFHLSATADGLRTAVPVAAFARPTTTSRDIHLVLESLARIRGHVVMNGEPLGGVRVIAARDGAPSVSGISLDDGSFVIDGVPYGKAHLVASPYRAVAPVDVQVTKAVVDDVRIDVTKMASIRGHVTRAGTPVAGADVWYMAPPQASNFGPDPKAKTDATGSFVLEGLSAGSGRIVAWDNPSKTFSDWRPVEVSAAQDMTIDIELACSGAVKGTVVNQTGRPVPGVYVRMDHTEVGDMCESMTDAAGQFDCTMLIGGTYRPTVAPSPGARQGFAPADHFDAIQVPKDGAVTGIRLAIVDERVALRGTVIDDAGAPVADVHVEAIGRGPSSMDFPSTMSDASGNFEIGDLAPGTYAVHAHAADGSETEVAGVVAGGDATRIRLVRAGAIEGTLAGFSRTPMVAIISIGSDLHVGGLATVDAMTFSRPGLPAGRYRVQAAAGPDVDAQLVEVRPGETAHVTLRARGLGTVEGTVSDGAHTPIAGMRCDAQLLLGGEMSPVPPDPSQQAFTDLGGHFTMPAPLGRVRIFCFFPNGGPHSPASSDVDVTSGAPVKVSVVSDRATPPPQ